MNCKYLFGVAAISGIALVGLMASAFDYYAILRQRKVETHGDSLALIGGALLGIVLVRRQKFATVLLTSQPRLLTVSGHLTLPCRPQRVSPANDQAGNSDQAWSGACKCLSVTEMPSEVQDRRSAPNPVRRNERQINNPK